MFQRNLGLALTLLSLGFFVPGILQPMFNLSMEMKAKLSGSILSADLVDKQLSIMATVEELWTEERILVAVLIFAFSVLIPLTKTILVSFAYWQRNTDVERKIMNFIASIGKWSMADVFVVAVFLAILSTNHAGTETAKQLQIFAFKIDLVVSSETLSSAGTGFYYFTAYCLLSLIGTQFYMNAFKRPLESDNSSSLTEGKSSSKDSKE